MVQAVSFSPDGAALAVVTQSPVGSGAPTGRSSDPLRLKLLEVDSGSLLWEDECCSPGVAWLRDPERVAYGQRNDQALRLLTRARTGGGDPLQSEQIAGETMGPLAARGNVVAFVTWGRDGSSDLCLWDLARGALYTFRVPPGFPPARDVSPVISQSRKIVAVVNQTRSCFLGFELASQRWRVPVVVKGRTGAPEELLPIWEWRDFELAQLPVPAWRTGGGFGGRHDLLLVDEGASAVWVAVANPPAGATPDRASASGRGFRMISTHDELVPLDLDEARAMTFGGEATMVAPRVWRDHVRAVSCDQDRTRIAVLYVEGSKSDCVLHTWETPTGWREEIVATDQPAVPPILALCPRGDHLASRRSGDSGDELVVLNTSDGSVVFTWP